MKNVWPTLLESAATNVASEAAQHITAGNCAATKHTGKTTHIQNHRN